MRLALVSALGLVMVGCAHAVSNEARLEAVSSTARTEAPNLDALNCRDGSPEAQGARDALASKAERVAGYDAAMARVKATQRQFDEVFRKDPDLVYGPQASQWQHRRQLCTDLLNAYQAEREALDAPAVAAAPAKVATPVYEDEKPAKVAKAKKAKVAKVPKRGSKERLARAD
jgi:hypothetical protein